jgi:hypothetical protein
MPKRSTKKAAVKKAVKKATKPKARGVPRVETVRAAEKAIAKREAAKAPALDRIEPDFQIPEEIDVECPQVDAPVAVPVAPAKEWTQDRVLDAIEICRHAGEAWAMVRDCPDDTSIAKCRTADAIVAGCWSSKGFTIHGYEVKVTRADWQREIKDHQKSLDFMKLVDFWWLACPAGIARLEEIPGNWGFIEVSKNLKGEYSAKIRRQATKLEREGRGQHGGTVPYGLFCAALRKATKSNPEQNRVDRLVDEAHKQGYESGRQATDRMTTAELDGLRRQAENLEKKIAEFEDKTGIQINSWNVDAVAEKFRRLSEICDFDPFHLESVAREAERMRAAALTVSRYLFEQQDCDWMGWAQAVQCPTHHPTIENDCQLCRAADLLRAAIIDSQGQPFPFEPTREQARAKQIRDYRHKKSAPVEASKPEEELPTVERMDLFSLPEE